MMIPVGVDDQQLLKITRQGDEFSSQLIEMVRFVPLIAGDLA
jgi:protein-L-isoaspartate(D-aspartate) O-methyltransferase